MLDALLSPLRLPERALDALVGIPQDLAALRRTIEGGLTGLEEVTAALSVDLRPIRTDVAAVRGSTSTLPEGIARLEKSVDGLGPKLDQLHHGMGTLHGDLSELSAYVQGLGTQLDTVIGATAPLDAHAAGLDQNTRMVLERLGVIDQTLTALKVSIEGVTSDLPGASGSGPMARLRKAAAGGEPE